MNVVDALAFDRTLTCCGTPRLPVRGKLTEAKGLGDTMDAVSVGSFIKEEESYMPIIVSNCC